MHSRNSVRYKKMVFQVSYTLLFVVLVFKEIKLVNLGKNWRRLINAYGLPVRSPSSNGRVRQPLVSCDV